jgi:dihydroorotate dehydrogenase electron transfer subunit
MLQNGNYDVCGICGPEKMMKVAADQALASKCKTKIQISMERYMKCGVGICGSCVLDDIGARVCSEGPVFDLETLQKCGEFGVYHRNGYGQIEK